MYDVLEWSSSGLETEITAINLQLVYGQIYYFSVKSKSNLGAWSDIGVSDGITVIEEQLRQVEIYLYEGWNLVSTGIDIGETDLLKILSPIQELCRSAWTYYSNPGWEYYIYNESNPMSTLYMLDPRKGYWIEMDVEAILTLVGRSLDNMSIQLYSGWNLVGYCALQPQFLHDLSSSMPDRVAIYAYDNLSGVWMKYLIGAPNHMNNLIQLKSGKGYWIYVPEDWVWNLAGK